MKQIAFGWWLAGAATLAGAAGMTVAFRRRRAASSRPGVPSDSPDPAAHFVADNLLAQTAVAISGLSNVYQFAHPQAAPGYRLVDAVAMADAVLNWAEQGAANWDEDGQARLAALRKGLAIWAGQGLPFGERERVRGIIFSVILPLLANEDGKRWLMPWFFPHHGGSDIITNRLDAVGTWVGMYLVGPQTAAVLRPELRPFVDGWSHPLPTAGAEWPAFAEENWQPASLAEQRHALIQVFWRLLAFSVDVSDAGACSGSPACDVRQQAVWDIDGVLTDEQLKGDSAEAIAAGNMRRVQLIATAPARNYYLWEDVPRYDMFGAFIKLVCSLASAGAGAGLGDSLGKDLGELLQIGTDVATTGLQILNAITSGGSVAQAMQAALNNGLVAQLQSYAEMMIPGDLRADAASLARAATIVQKAAKGIYPF